MMPRAPGTARSVRSRRWCFTSYLAKDHFTALASLGEDKFSWMIVGAEICPDTQRHHCQGACVMAQPTTLATLKLLLDDPAVHCEIMKGTPGQSDTYCRKEDSAPFEFGDMPQQGKRSDIEALKESLVEGATDKELWSDHFAVMLKSDQAVKRYRLAMTEPRSPDTPPEIHIHTGPSGCGKTRAMPTGPDVFWHACGNWWDGYCGQSTVVFDEFYGQIPHKQMLRVLDRHPMAVETKGGTVQLTATKFYFTSNKGWQHWWLEAQQKTPNPLCMLAFSRRIEEFGTVVVYDMP